MWWLAINEVVYIKTWWSCVRNLMCFAARYQIVDSIYRHHEPIWPDANYALPHFVNHSIWNWFWRIPNINWSGRFYWDSRFLLQEHQIGLQHEMADAVAAHCPNSDQIHFPQHPDTKSENNCKWHRKEESCVSLKLLHHFLPRKNYITDTLRDLKYLSQSAK